LQEGTITCEQPLRVGIVGAGLQASRRAGVLSTSAEGKLVQVASRSLDDARAFTAVHGGTAVAHWEDLVGSDAVDLVIVATPPDSHADITRAALVAGKHVLCEKPLARTSEQARGMFATATKHDRLLRCGFNHRFHPALIRLKELVGSGSLGRPIALRCVYGIAGREGTEGEWRSDPSVVSGGQLMEQGIHAIDLTAWLLGGVTEVTGVTGTFVFDMAPLEDNAVALLRTGSGASATLHSSLTQWVNLFRLELSLTGAMVTVEGLGAAYGEHRLEVWRRTDGPFQAQTTYFRGGDRSWAAEWQSVLGELSHGGPWEYDDPSAGIDVVEAIYRAARERRWVSFLGEGAGRNVDR
jgi:predicted dehydrogenase